MPTDTPLPTSTPPPTDTPTPVVTLEPEAALSLAIQTALGSSNRDVTRVTRVSIILDTVIVEWAINDNLTQNMFRDGAYVDAAKILKAVHTHVPQAELINLTGTAALQSAGGFVNEAPVIWFELDRAAMDAINWQDEDFVDYSLYSRLDQLASVKRHPAFE